MSLLFSLNLIYSYPLTIHPANQIVESFVFKSIESNNPYRKYLKNLSRLVVCALSVFLAIHINQNPTSLVLNKYYLNLYGPLLGIPLILIVPIACHYRICAQTEA